MTGSLLVAMGMFALLGESNLVYADTAATTASDDVQSMTSKATVTFEQGTLSLEAVPSFDFGNHITRSDVNFPSLPATNLIKDGDAVSTITNTDYMKNSSYLHIVDQRGLWSSDANASDFTWSLSLSGTTPLDANKAPLKEATLSFPANKDTTFPITGFWSHPTVTGGNVKTIPVGAVGSTNTLIQVSTVPISLDGTPASKPIFSLANNSKVNDEAIQNGGDFFIDVGPQGSGMMKVPTASQTEGVYKSTLTWTLSAGL
ncbi:WxL domain-containing protein [Lacticaseibacillus saniviri]